MATLAEVAENEPEDVAEEEKEEEEEEDDDKAVDEAHACVRASNPLREATAFGEVKTPCAVRGRDEP